MLVFDIETVGVDPRTLHERDREKMERRAKARGDASDLMLGTFPWTCKVAVFSAWNTDKEAGVCLVSGMGVRQEDMPAGFVLVECEGEAELVGKAWAMLGRATSWGTYNGRGFDVPVLLSRALVHGARVHGPLVQAKRYETKHLDLMDVLTCNGSSRDVAPLDMVCRALGVVSSKGEIDGSQVGEAWSDGRKALVARYCCEDVTATKCCIKLLRESLGV